MNEHLLTLVARHNVERIKGNSQPQEHSSRPKPIVIEEVEPIPLGLLLSVQTPPPTPYIEDGILFPGTVMVIGGASKARKSWLAMDLALSLVSGTPFLTHTVPEKLRVLLLSGEGMMWSLKKNLAQAIAFKVGIEESNLDKLWVLPTLGHIKIDTEKGENWLKEWPSAFQVVIIDPYYRFLAHGRENLHEDQRAIQDIFDRLKAKGKAIVLAHHLRKPQGEDLGQQELRGAGLDQFADSILILQRKRTATSDRTTLHYTLRLAPEPDPLELTTTAETGPLLIPAEKSDRLVNVADVVSIIQEKGGRVKKRKTLVEALCLKTGAKETTARMAIMEAERKGHILSAPWPKDKRKREYFLKEEE